MRLAPFRSSCSCSSAPAPSSSSPLPSFLTPSVSLIRAAARCFLRRRLQSVCPTSSCCLCDCACFFFCGCSCGCARGWRSFAVYRRLAKSRRRSSLARRVCCGRFVERHRNELDGECLVGERPKHTPESCSHVPCRLRTQLRVLRPATSAENVCTPIFGVTDTTWPVAVEMITMIKPPFDATIMTAWSPAQHVKTAVWRWRWSVWRSGGAARPLRSTF